jgi:hypothetical protein
MSKRATDPSRYSAMNVTLSVSFLFGIAAQYARNCAIGIGVADGALEPLQRRLSAQMNDDVETWPCHRPLIEIDHSERLIGCIECNR